jgi:hypothetical protein
LRRVPAPKGSKPIVRINNLRREGVYVYCALNAHSGEAFIKIKREQQIYSMSFLYSLKKHVGRWRIYIVWDNSAAHRSKYVYEHRGREFLEYQGKCLIKPYGINVPRGFVASRNKSTSSRSL